MNNSAYFFDVERNLFRRKKFNSDFAYSDGDQEENHVRTIIANAADRSLFSEELRAGIRDWSSRYHLSPGRGSLLFPYQEQLRGKSVLEIGCGCGAISRTLCELGASLTAVEGSERRASVAATRCGEFKDAKFYCDNFESFETGETFDVVTLIGVLEYANQFCSGPDTATSMLKKARSFLKADGILILALENKLGLKYFNQTPEDHTGILFQGIQGLYSSDGVQTFSRQELSEKLTGAGFSAVEFHYPFPDYKFPSLLVHPGAFDAPELKISELLLSRNATEPWNTDKLFCSELVWRELENDGLLGQFANSFLVIAGNRPEEKTDVCVTHLSWNRKKEQTRMRVFRKGANGVFLENRRIADQPGISFSLPEETKTPYLRGKLLIGELFERMSPPSATLADAIPCFREWLAFLDQYVVFQEEGKTLPFSLFDALPQNIIRTEQGLYFFDREFQQKKVLSYFYIVFRGVWHSLESLGSLHENSEGKTMMTLVEDLWLRLGLPRTELRIDTFLEQEFDLLKDVLFDFPDDRRAYIQMVRDSAPGKFNSDRLAEFRAAVSTERQKNAMLQTDLEQHKLTTESLKKELYERQNKTRNFQSPYFENRAKRKQRRCC